MLLEGLRVMKKIKQDDKLGQGYHAKISSKSSLLPALQMKFAWHSAMPIPFT